jgi:hypothetical protein
MEDNFDRLRRIIALKRYEAPPPGFFENFSSKVMARIESAEMTVTPAWWQKLGFDFNFKPALVCGLGVVVCGLLSAGMLTSVMETAHQPVAGWSMETPVAFGASPFVQYAADSVPRSTEPVFSAKRFDQFGLRAQPVSFRFGK